MSGRVPAGGLTCAVVRERLALHVYGAADEGGAIDAHLASCPACARAWAETRDILLSVAAADAFPHEAEVDWGAFARATALVARAASPGSHATPARSPIGSAVPAAAARGPARGLLWGGVLAAAAALIVLAGLRQRAGSHAGHDAGPVAGPAASAGVAGGRESAELLQENLARRAAARSLQDGRALLVDLMQAPVRCRRSDGSYDIALAKERSRELLRRMNLYQGTLNGPADRRLFELMGQLETTLLQVSSLDDCTLAQAIHDLRDAIERRQLLLRIDLVTREVEGGGARA